MGKLNNAPQDTADQPAGPLLKTGPPRPNPPGERLGGGGGGLDPNGGNRTPHAPLGGGGAVVYVLGLWVCEGRTLVMGWGAVWESGREQPPPPSCAMSPLGRRTPARLGGCH